MSLEKSIINRNYVHLTNDSNIWSFGSIDDQTKQINLEYDGKTYKFSFPIKDIHYSTTFENKDELNEYIRYILKEHIF